MDKELTRLIGIPWKVGGRDYTGVDCGGLVILASLKLYNIYIPDMWVYTKDNNFEVARNALNDLQLFADPIDHVEEGAIVVLTIKDAVHYGLAVQGKYLTIFEKTRSHMRRFVPRSTYYRVRRDCKWG